jgi:hypothetical protein
MKFRVVLERSEEGGFTAVVPGLPGCISEGDTREEAQGPQPELRRGGSGAPAGWVGRGPTAG